MGVYNTYGDKINLQMKVAPELTLEHFGLGDKVDIPDGIYIGYEGVVAVKGGVLIAEFNEVFDKWGNTLDIEIILNHYNPIAQATKSLEQEPHDRPGR